jgi:hypothetical protein
MRQLQHAAKIYARLTKFTFLAKIEHAAELIVYRRVKGKWGWMGLGFISVSQKFVVNARLAKFSSPFLQ